MTAKTRTPEYTERQMSVAALHAQALLTRNWFGGKFPAEESQSMAALLLGLYVAYRQGRLPTKNEVADWMGVEHPQTARRYIEQARALGLVEVAQSQNDKRKFLVVPTKALLSFVKDELTALADDVRLAADALLVDELPETGAPILEGSLEGYTVFPGQDGPRGPEESNQYLTELDLDAGGYEDASPLMMSILVHPVPKRKEIETALEAELSETIRLTPDNFMAHYKRAWLYRATKQDDLVIADLTEAIRLRPTEARLYAERGWCYLAASELDRAISDFNETIRLGPNDPFAAAYRGRAKAYAARGNHDAAVADLRSALAVYALRHRSYELDVEIEWVLKDVEALGINPKALGVDDPEDDQELDDATLEEYNAKYWADVRDRTAKYQEAQATLRSLTAISVEFNRTRRLARLRASPR